MHFISKKCTYSTIYFDANRLSFLKITSGKCPPSFTSQECSGDRKLSITSANMSLGIAAISSWMGACNSAIVSLRVEKTFYLS